MATIVSSTIGTGGTYSTLQAWEDACPANLTSVDQIWQGQVKNQEFTSASTLLTISGSVTSVSCYAELTTEAGASFADHANKATNALSYNASNGAAIRITGDYAVGVQISQEYTRLSKLQIAGSSTGGAASAAVNISTANGVNCDINQCIIESFSASAGLGSLSMDGAGNVVRNSLVVQKRSGSPGLIANISNGSSAYNCTFVSTQAAATVGVKTVYAVGVLKNVYIGNATTPTSGSHTKTNCYSSTAATGFTVAAHSTATFESVTHGSHDYRLKSGSSLIDAGATEATYAASDIIGTARATYDVGAWEFASGGGGGSVTGTASWTEANDSASISGTVTVPTFTLTTSPLKNNTGTVLANETGITVHVYEVTDGELVVTKTAQTTDALGVLAVTDALLADGAEYRVVIVLGSGAEGMDRIEAS